MKEAICYIFAGIQFTYGVLSMFVAFYPWGQIDYGRVAFWFIVFMTGFLWLSLAEL